jgi:DNA-binding NarL/FixJ family response regulator
MVASPIRILCVDDHPVVRRGIAAILAIEPDLELAGEAASVREAVTQYALCRPDVTLMDLRLPDGTGLEALAKIHALFPAARVLMLSSYDGDQDIYHALEAGVRGYLLKETLHTELVNAIRAAHAGKKFIPPNVAERICEFFPEIALTLRETQILDHVANGLGNREIGSELGTAPGTVKAQVQSILAKLNARDRTHAVTIGLRRGIIHMFSRTM